MPQVFRAGLYSEVNSSMEAVRILMALSTENAEYMELGELRCQLSGRI